MCRRSYLDVIELRPDAHVPEDEYFVMGDHRDQLE